MGMSLRVRVFDVAFKSLAKLTLLALCMQVLFLQPILIVNASVNDIDPDPSNAGSLSQGAQTTCGSSVNNAECLNDGVASTSAPNTSGDYLTFSDAQSDSYLMTSFLGAATTTAITVELYHVEGTVDMRFEVSLWDGTESSQYGSTQNITTRTSAQWDAATFTGLSLSQSELNDLRVQISCVYLGGGSSDTCTGYALYADVFFDQLDTTANDFFVQRGTAILTGDTLTLTAGTDYIAPSASTSAFIRITNSHHTGAGNTAGSPTQNADDVTAFITDPWNITDSVTLARGSSAASSTRVDWEIIEYTGDSGGDNEMIVRQQQNVTYNSSATSTSGPTVPSVSDDADIVVFITGQFNPDTGIDDYNTVLSTAAWDSASDRTDFVRGEAGGDAVQVSYAVVEFTGPNWKIQRVSDHVYSNAGSVETESITALGSLNRAFIHTQKRVGAGLSTHDDFGHEVWLSGLGEVSYELSDNATSPSEHVTAVWIIENVQSSGDSMHVTRSNGSQSGGAEPTTLSVSIGKMLTNASSTSIFLNNRGGGTGSTWPEPLIAAKIASSTHYELWMSNTGDTRYYRTEIVEWPTATRRITQNYFRFYVPNGLIDPTDPWPTGITDLGENTEITGLDDPLQFGESIRVRMTLQIAGASLAANVESFKLQYGERTTTCTAIAENQWNNLGDIGSTTALWRGTSTPVVDGTVLSGDPPTGGDLNISLSDVAGTFEEQNDTAVVPYQVLPGEDIEYDWAIEHNGAKEKTPYCFRMVESDGMPFDSYSYYPTMATAGYGAESQDWKWFSDVENETPTTALAATNTAPTDIAFTDPLELRLVLREVNGATGISVKFKLQFSEYADFSTSTDVTEITDCTDSSLWCYVDGGGVDNATITTRTLGTADTCTAGVGVGCGMHNESGTSSSTSEYVHHTGDAAEFAFTIKHAGARVNRVYYFRAYDAVNNEAVPLSVGKSYPSLVTEGASVSFGLAGIPSATVIEGITTDLDTTSSQINFGTVLPGTQVEAAHRLSIDTNGTEGYQILMYTTGDFMSSQGVRIDPFVGSNAAPLGWSTGCTADKKGCFGYHAGDDLLQGGSTRFTPNDSYAAFSSTTPEEISYSSFPTINDTTDVIYKLEIHDLQEAGKYETNIVYIAVPFF